MLEGSGFLLRYDDPEKLVDVATHWDHVDKFKFSASTGGAFAETLMFIDDKVLRIIVLKVEASECQRSASFRIWTDETRTLRLECVGYVN